MTISLPQAEATRIRRKAKHLGYPSVSHFVRAQVKEVIDMATFTDEDILKSAREAERLHAKGELPELTSIADLLDREGLR